MCVVQPFVAKVLESEIKVSDCFWVLCKLEIVSLAQRFKPKGGPTESSYLLPLCPPLEPPLDELPPPPRPSRLGGGLSSFFFGVEFWGSRFLL